MCSCSVVPSPLPHLPAASDRADALGKLGVSYGLGMVVGPYMGGYLTLHFSEEVAALVAGGLCVLGISFVWLFVPKSTKRASEKEKAPKGVWSTVNVDWKEGGRNLRRRAMNCLWHNTGALLALHTLYVHAQRCTAVMVIKHAHLV